MTTPRSSDTESFVSCVLFGAGTMQRAKPPTLTLALLSVVPYEYLSASGKVGYFRLVIVISMLAHNDARVSVGAKASNM